MRIIPVMDLMRGYAVHAQGGARERYDVVDGVLGSGREPLALATAFQEQLGCTSLYLADLDAITTATPPNPLLSEIAGLGLEVWCDAGVHSVVQAESLLELGAERIIVGSETLRSMRELNDVARAIGVDRVVFSLDLREGAPLAVAPEVAGRGPLSLAREAAAVGVKEMICLDLSRVGTSNGPPLDLLARIRSELPGVSVYAGGGVRGEKDLARLAEAGSAGALVATALHRGRIGPAEVERWMSATSPPS